MGSPLVTLGLVLLLVAIGTALTVDGFTAELRRPRALASAAAMNVLLVPAFAVILVNGWLWTGRSPTGSCSPQPRPAGAPARCRRTTHAAIRPRE